MRISAMRGWRGVALIAATYTYFLIFAQFAFLNRLAELGMAGNTIRMIMAAMAIAGVLASLLAPGLARLRSYAAGVHIGFAVCGIAALAALLPLGTAAAASDAFVIGAGLGLLTVTLVTHLRRWTGSEHALLKVGLGTGLGYFICNVPWIFAATPERQAIAAAVACAAGMWCAGGATERSPAQPAPSRHAGGFVRILAAFAALVWLDSAAFYIIQHSSALKAGTWMGTAHLWTNACLHLAAAIAAGLLLARKGTALVLASAFCALGAACVLLLDPTHSPQASLFYPVGVSLYSTALVAYPSFLAGGLSPTQRGRRAGIIYAVAGWIGSALGIGMGQNLGRVPLVFVAVAGAVVLGPVMLPLVRGRKREIVAVGAAAALALVLGRITVQAHDRNLTPAERGRKVYISEGCIHCHSQYVRPNTADVLMWGPVESLAEVHEQKPPLIGNRRQGPDLAQVGTRRSPLWLKAHLIDPAEVSGRSVMPNFGFLFADRRGDDLVAYLASLHSGDVSSHAAAEKAWGPSAASLERATAAEGAAVYRTFCATCHDADGLTRQKWAASFRTLPTDLRTGPLRDVRDPDPKARFLHMAQIAKFGIAGTDMPGHEYLSDEQIAAVSLWLMRPSAQASLQQQVKTGDKE